MNTQTRAVPTANRRPMGFATAAVGDLVAWTAGFAIAAYVAADFLLTGVRTGTLFVPLVVAGGLQVLIGHLTGLYGAGHRRGSARELRALIVTVLAAGAVAAAPTLFVAATNQLAGLLPTVLPRAAVIIAVPATLSLAGGWRFLVRLLVERRSAPADDARRALVFGAGSAGDLVVRRILAERSAPFVPVGLLDDDERLRFLRLEGLTVRGTRHDVVAAARETGADCLILAIAQPSDDLLDVLVAHCAEAGLQLLRVPTLEQMLTGMGSVHDLRDVVIGDVLGRRAAGPPAGFDACYIAGARVLVTGAGGSIGAELCRQIAQLSPAELIMLDRDETALQAVQVDIAGHGLLDTRDVVLADIRDRDAMREIFDERRPTVVFHAAALKHLPMLEQYPDEGFKTNVLGTANVLEAAEQAGVEVFVNISTDKAADPTSVLGATKRLAERLTATAATRASGTYLSVRFGNVLGSRGSMLPLFSDLIHAGRPITITHPDVTRYFMSIPEACHLVLEAAGIGVPGEVLILDMGQPVRILDIAQRMIALSGREVDIVFTGLRDGEKLHEQLLGDGEPESRPVHPKISHAVVPPLDEPVEGLRQVFEAWRAPAADDHGGRVLR